MTLKLEILNPIDFAGWDKLVLTAKEYSFFHSLAWATVLSESYSYTPRYFVVANNGKLSALIPIMEVKSLLTGRRGVSLPFTDYCQPIVSDNINFQAVIDDLIDYGKKAGWKYIEWRGSESYFQDITPSSFYYGHILDLTQNEQEILSSFRSNTKRNIKKALKERVYVEISNSLESIMAFYRLNCITRKHHGLPPQPFFFFKKIFEHVVSKNCGFLALASHSKRVIAGAVFFHLGNKSIYKYGASDLRYQHLRPNNLVMWEAIRYYAQRGFKSLSLGRTEPKNEGLLQFKRGWGAREETIRYYKYDLIKNAFVKDHSRVNMFSNLFRKMPVPLLNFVSFLFYRHVG